MVMLQLSEHVLKLLSSINSFSNQNITLNTIYNYNSYQNSLNNFILNKPIYNKAVARIKFVYLWEFNF